jgi:hypothetical protein
MPCESPEAPALGEFTIATGCIARVAGDRAGARPLSPRHARASVALGGAGSRVTVASRRRAARQRLSSTQTSAAAKAICPKVAAVPRLAAPSIVGDRGDDHETEQPKDPLDHPWSQAGRLFRGRRRERVRRRPGRRRQRGAARAARRGSPRSPCSAAKSASALRAAAAPPRSSRSRWASIAPPARRCRSPARSRRGHDLGVAVASGAAPCGCAARAGRRRRGRPCDHEGRGSPRSPP